MLRGYLIAEEDGRSVAVGRSLVVGRTRDCGFAIDDSAASRRHVEITCREGGFVWKDLGSTNGTLLNGSRMLAGELKHGDAIQIGETVLRFEVEETPEDTPAQSDSSLFRETILDSLGHVQPAPSPSKSRSQRRDRPAESMAAMLYQRPGRL